MGDSMKCPGLIVLLFYYCQQWTLDLHLASKE